MVKRVILFCEVIFAGIFCMSATAKTNNIEVASYAEDGLVSDSSEIQLENRRLEQYKPQLDKHVEVANNQFIVDYESIKKIDGFDEKVLIQLRENIDFANELAKEKPEIVTIRDDKSLDFNVEDEYAEQWNAWQLSWNFWEGLTYKLDSDFGKLVGISGIVYRLMSFIANGDLFFKNMMSITSQSQLASTLSTLFFYLPGTGVTDIISTYLRNFVGAIAAGLVTVNLTLMTFKCASFGIGWLAFKIIDFIIGRVAPSLITSCSIAYNCFKYNAPIYCKISLWKAGIIYSLSKL